MNEKTRKSALKALDGMAQVITNEMLLHGEYITDEVESPTLAAAGAVCGGHRACAVGALFLGGGVKYETGEWGVSLPGSLPFERPDYLARRPGLRLAYDALNDAATTKHPRLLKRVIADAETERGYDHDESTYVESVGAMEALFESGLFGRNDSSEIASKAEQRKLLAIIDIARQRIEAA